MARVEQIPEVVGDEERHPAYGQIAVCRSNGSSVLYGSDFVHSHTISLEISHSVLTRQIGYDSPHAKGRIMTLRMSEAQWAAFVGGMGNGDGTQCTLEWLDGKSLPGIPMPKDRQSQFDSELRKRLEVAVSAIERAVKKIDAAAMTKKVKDDLLSEMHQAKMNIGVNAQYVADCFSEHMEKTVTKAKTEIHGHMQNVLQRSGLSALQQGNLLLQIEAPKDK